MTPLVVDPSGYLKPHHSVGHCRVDVLVYRICDRMHQCSTAEVTIVSLGR